MRHDGGGEGQENVVVASCNGAEYELQYQPKQLSQRSLDTSHLQCKGKVASRMRQPAADTHWRPKDSTPAHAAAAAAAAAPTRKACSEGGGCGL